MEWNAESVLDALNDFERKPELCPILDEYLQRIAKNGEIIFPWSKLKPLLKKKLEVVLDEFYETCPVETSVPVPNFETFNFDSLKKSILQAVDAFTSAPFTIQRLCELVTNPQKHYNRTDKYMRGIEKNVLVVSTIEPRTGAQVDGNNGNNIVIVNGMMNDSTREESDTLNGHENDSSDNVSSSNLDTPSNHVLLENFANVFPSAACIPSASNIINKNIDIDDICINSNFISTTDSGDRSEEVDFESPAEEQSTTETTSEVKEEAMDTTEEDSVADSAEGDGMLTAEVSESSPEPLEAEETKEKIESSENIVDGDAKMDAISTVKEEDAENEVDSSEVAKEVPEVDVKAEGDMGQQDDTISQSDGSSNDSEKVPKTEETGDALDSEICVKVELIVEEAVSETDSSVQEEAVSDTSDSVTHCESSSELSMELESDKSSDLPNE